MLIDWFTVLAQILNFLILVALLKHFLYGRIVQAMDAREHTIAARLEDAATQRAEAQREADDCRKQRQELEATRNEFLAQAKTEAEERRSELEHKARQEVDLLRDRWQEALRQETDTFIQELRERAADQVCVIARRALADLANVELEQQVVEVFLEDLQNLDEERRTALTEAIREGGNTLMVQSAFDLPDKTRRKLIHVLRELFANDAEVRFITAPELVCGVAVEAHGQKIVWGVEHYMDILQQRVTTLLAEKTRHPNDEEEEQEEENLNQASAASPPPY
ncbi:MAG: F0F1 ATP synthase subunit B [Candidatus Binatia bacterium]